VRIARHPKALRASAVAAGKGVLARFGATLSAMASSSRRVLLGPLLLLGGCVLGYVGLDDLECPCAEGWVCQGEVCVREDDAVDGGPVADASLDAAEPDLGRDAGTSADLGPDDLGPEDLGVDASTSPFRAIAPGDSVVLDLGGAATTNWAYIMQNGMVGPLFSTQGEATSVTFTATGFVGENNDGASANDFDYPATAARDTSWTGSFDGHAAALPLVANVAIGGLPPGSYTLHLYASRSGDDSGNFRLTRYTVAGVAQDLEVSDNTSTRIEYVVAPDADGSVSIDVQVSPEGTSRFAYLGVVEITRDP